MPAISETPTNMNFLSPLNFKFILKRAPNVNFFIQKINIPGLALPSIDVNNPLIRIPYAGDHILYNELQITYKIDEDLQNYLEIFNWLKSIGKQEYSLYSSIKKDSQLAGGGLKSDIILMILNGTKEPNYSITFQDSFPIGISDVAFESDNADVNYLSVTVQFRYTLYDIEKII